MSAATGIFNESNNLCSVIQMSWHDINHTTQLQHTFDVPSHPSHHATNPLKHIQPVYNTIRYDHTGTYILCGGTQRTPVLYNTNTMKLIQSYDNTIHGYSILDLAISHDSTTFVTCGIDKYIVQWDTTTNQCISKLRSFTELQLNSIQYNYNSQCVVTGGNDTNVYIFDNKQYKSSKPISILTDATDNINSISLDDHMMGTAGNDGVVRLYDIRMGRLIQDYILQSITSLQINHQYILCSCTDNTCKLFNIYNNELIHSLNQHQHQQYKIQSSMDYGNKYIYTGSEDNNVYRYSILSHDTAVQPIHQAAILSSHHNIVHVTACNPINNQLATASLDGTLKLWN